MGYSCTAMAGFAAASMLDQMQTAHGNASNCGNTYGSASASYFDERGREQRDGAITGAIIGPHILAEDGRRFIPNNSKSRGYRVEANGIVKRWPGSTPAQRLHALRVAIVKYANAYGAPECWRTACEAFGIDPSSKFVAFPNTVAEIAA